jgi:hypothetical protein
MSALINVELAENNNMAIENAQRFELASLFTWFDIASPYSLKK